MPAYRTIIRGLEIEVSPTFHARPEQVQVTFDATEAPGNMKGLPKVQKWQVVSIGAPRGETMCRFTVTARPIRLVTPPGPSALTVGFVQNVMKTSRLATYVESSLQSLATIFTVSRPSDKVGNGLRDGGSEGRPWYGDKSEPLRRLDMPALPYVDAVVEASDNARWDVPFKLEVGTSVALARQVELSAEFLLYAVVLHEEQRQYHAVASLRWGTDVLFMNNETTMPTGTFLGRRVWADPQWSSPVSTQPNLRGETANKILVNELKQPM